MTNGGCAVERGSKLPAEVRSGERQRQRRSSASRGKNGVRRGRGGVSEVIVWFNGVCCFGSFGGAGWSARRRGVRGKSDADHCSLARSKSAGRARAAHSYAAATAGDNKNNHSRGTRHREYEATIIASGGGGWEELRTRTGKPRGYPQLATGALLYLLLSLTSSHDASQKA